jgi:hypothetical protein
MSSTTTFLSRLFGLYYICLGLAMLVHPRVFVETITALIQDAPVMFLASILALLGGLALVLAHNVWSGGARTAIITLIGWIALAKGLLFLFVTRDTEVGLYLTGLGFTQLYYVYTAIALALGIYLAWGGFKATRS